MKLILAVVLAISGFFIYLPQNIFAASVEMAQITDEEREMAQAVAIDFIYSRTFERTLKAESGIDTINPMYQGHVKIAYTKIQQAQPYLKLGYTQFKEDFAKVNISGLGRRDVLFSYSAGFSYGAGLDGMFKIPYGLSAGYDLQYLRSMHQLNKVRHNARVASDCEGEVLLQEWHTAFLLAKEFKFGKQNFRYEDADIEFPLSLTPYLGVRRSDLKLKITKDITYTSSEGIIGFTGYSKAEDNFGAFGGLAANFGDNWGLRFEGRFLDETGISFSGSYKF